MNTSNTMIRLTLVTKISAIQWSVSATPYICYVAITDYKNQKADTWSDPQSYDILINNVSKPNTKQSYTEMEGEADMTS